MIFHVVSQGVIINHTPLFAVALIVVSGASYLAWVSWTVTEVSDLSWVCLLTSEIKTVLSMSSFHFCNPHITKIQFTLAELPHFMDFCDLLRHTDVSRCYVDLFQMETCSRHQHEIE